MISVTCLPTACLCSSFSFLTHCRCSSIRVCICSSISFLTCSYDQCYMSSNRMSLLFIFIFDTLPLFFDPRMYLLFSFILTRSYDQCHMSSNRVSLLFIFIFDTLPLIFDPRMYLLFSFILTRSYDQCHMSSNRVSLLFILIFERTAAACQKWKWRAKTHG